MHKARPSQLTALKCPEEFVVQNWSFGDFCQLSSITTIWEESLLCGGLIILLASSEFAAKFAVRYGHSSLQKTLTF